MLEQLWLKWKDKDFLRPEPSSGETMCEKCTSHSFRDQQKPTAHLSCEFLAAPPIQTGEASNKGPCPCDIHIWKEYSHFKCKSDFDWLWRHLDKECAIRRFHVESSFPNGCKSEKTRNTIDIYIMLYDWT